MKLSKPAKIAGALFGTVVEFYDYSLYGFSAGIIATKFFPNADFLQGLTYAFAVYASAYIAKPIGAIIFGYIGDHYGRKTALNITIIGIVIPTLLIGLLPEYSAIGAVSTVILVICRFTQGIFAAGEYDGAAIYVIEHLGQKLHYTASAITRATGTAGLLLGIWATNFFNAHIFPSWGWRIPFLLSLPLALVTLYCRSRLVETPDFKVTKSTTKIKDFSFLQDQKYILVLIILFAGSCGAMYQVSIIFMKQYLPIILPKIEFVISIFSILLVVCFGLVMPISGLCADKFGHLRIINISTCLIILSSILLVIAAYYGMMNLALTACLILAASVAPFNALAHGIIIRSFLVNERYRGISLGHTIGSMLLSGSANYICSLLITRFSFFPIFYVIFFAILACIIVHIYEYKIISKTQLISSNQNYNSKE